MAATPASHLIPIATHRLEPGMYVAELDRSWLHTPFADRAGPGFLITDTVQVEQLRRICRYVYVDPARTVGVDAYATYPEPGKNSDPAFSAARTAGEIGLARSVIDDTVLMLAEEVRGARRHGRLPVRPFVERAEAIINHVEQDADLLLWLIRSDLGGGYLYRRAVGTAVTMAVFGRHLGFDHATQRDITTGGLLLDLGKVAVPVPILAKPNALNVMEQAYVRRHVERGVDLLSAAQDVPARALEMLIGHHERIDGSGYPRGLTGTEIPFFARLAAIADAFDALTLNRRYAAAMSPHAAILLVDSLGSEKFDNALVGEFIDALGVFPTGTWVELIDGHFGLVCAQRQDKPATPRVVVTRDRWQQRLPEPYVVNTDVDIAIVRAMPPGSATVDARILERARNIAA